MMRSKPQPLEAGRPAPDFAATTHDGTVVSLSAMRGRTVALYFYPKDDTPGCTKQACNLRDHLHVLERAGVSVIGVSPDDNDSHARFAAANGLTFPLIADPERTIIDAYGVWGEKQNYGRTYLGLQRTTFLIGPDGVVAHVFKRPKTSDHAAEILRRVERLVPSAGN